MAVALSSGYRLTPLGQAIYNYVAGFHAIGDVSGGLITYSGAIPGIGKDDELAVKEVYTYQTSANTVTVELEIVTQEWTLLHPGLSTPAYHLLNGSGTDFWQTGPYGLNARSTKTQPNTIFLGKTLVAAPAMTITFDSNADGKAYDLIIRGILRRTSELKS